MPKENIDYSETIIYKIYCKDETIKEIYVGHTTNFHVRKYQHKNACNSKTDLKIYNIIRENGGWNNWCMVEIAKYNCNDSTEARIKEQQHYEELKASLNSVPPYVDKKKYFCIDCNLQCAGPTHYKQHMDTNIHNKKYNEQNDCKTQLSIPHPINIAKNRREYNCKKCDYITFNKYDYTKHCDTIKHKNAISAIAIANLSQDLSQKSQHVFKCECGKIYRDNSGLWKHKKQCVIAGTKSSGEITTELVLQLIKDNRDMQKLFMEHSQTIQQQNNTLTNMVHDVVKNGVNNNHSNNTTTNSHNKAFNLNFFLNETCKEAINMSDFVSSIKMSLDDLEHTGRNGYIEGISNIIIRNLNDLEHHNRPIHCSDNKREILYIKDNNKWEKECDDKPILTKAIKVIANENIKQIKNWQEKNPDCKSADSKKNNLYLKIVSNSMNGLTEEEGHKNINKIISNVAKKTIIHKTM